MSQYQVERPCFKSEGVRKQVHSEYCVPLNFVDTFIVTTAGARSRGEDLMMD